MTEINTPNIAPRIIQINQPYVSQYDLLGLQVHVYSIDLLANQRITFSLIHMSKEIQDYTIGCWFSLTPLENVIRQPNSSYYFSLEHNGTKHFSLQDKNNIDNNFTPDRIIFYLNPGRYYFNIENKMNFDHNQYGLSYTSETI